MTATVDDTKQRKLAVRRRLLSQYGCKECRRRKKKCDEVKPACGLCQHLGRDCLWPWTLAATKQQQSELPAHTFHPWSAFQLHNNDDGQALVRHSLDIDPAQRRIVYLLDLVFWGRQTQWHSKYDSATLTMESELKYARSLDTIAGSCLNSMALLFWGTRQSNQKALKFGYEARGACLKRIRTAIDEGDVSGDLVAAVSLTRLFEIVLPEGPTSSWITHAQGLILLFQAIGPIALASSPLRALFEKNRWMMITVSSLARKRTPFDTVAWTVGPWTLAHKDMMQKLLDVYAKVPAIHVAWDEQSPLVLSAIQTALCQLQDWRQEFDQELNGSVAEWDQSKVLLPCPWTKALSFKAVLHAYSTVLYNMVLILLSCYLAKLPNASDMSQLKCGPTSQRTGLLGPAPLPLGSPILKAGDAADEIAACTAWILHTSAIGSMYIAGPLYICQEFWQKTNPSKAEWAVKVVRWIVSSRKHSSEALISPITKPEHCVVYRSRQPVI